MRRVDTIRIHRWLWLAVCVNDLHEYSHPRLGFTQTHAWGRSVSAAEKQEDTDE